MNQDRISACNVNAFEGALHLQAEIHTKQSQFSAELKRSQSQSSGNRCDHNKNSFKRPKVLRNAKRRPHCLEEAKRRIYEAIDNNFRYPKFAEIFFHKNGCGGDGAPVRHLARKRRSEGVEGILSLTLPLLLHTLNLHKMACGFYDKNNNFHYRDYVYLETSTDQSSIRIKREMAVLKRLEIINVINMREQNNDGTWRHIGTRIEFTDKIFDMLELMPEFLADREYSYRRFQKDQKIIDNKEKTLSSFKPKNPYERKSKVDNSRVESCQSSAKILTKSMRPNQYKYNPSSDKQVIALAGELLKAQLCANVRDAITLACTKLGKPPPN
jgi:hypothetical protein